MAWFMRMIPLALVSSVFAAGKTQFEAYAVAHSAIFYLRWISLKVCARAVPLL